MWDWEDARVGVGCTPPEECKRLLAKQKLQKAQEELAVRGGHSKKKDEKSTEQLRLSNAVYSPQQLEGDQLKTQPRLSPGKNFDRCFEADVEVEGENIEWRMFIDSFDQAFYKKVILRNIEDFGYTKPMLIQKHAMPYIITMRDVVGVAPTGSEKTAAYVLPILHHILKRGDLDWILPDRHHPAPAAIIMAPTRELAEQIKDEARKYAYGTKIQVVSVYGGTNLRSQVDIIRNKGCNILVGTPGRLLQILREGRFRLCKVKWVVLDEAHRLLESMEDEPAVRQVLQYRDLPAIGDYRNTLMFSATFPKAIRKVAEEFLCDPVYITVGKSGGANEDIAQELVLVKGFDKYEKLNGLIRDGLKPAEDGGQPSVKKVLIFVERKDVADVVASRISQMGLSTAPIHGDREQREREFALRDFKAGRCSVLVATAVAARGLDIVQVDHVINFDLPSTIEDYVHRIGRTGRVGNPGRATSLYDPKANKELAPALLKVLLDAQQEVPDWFLEEAGSDVATGTSSRGDQDKAAYSEGVGTMKKVGKSTDEPEYEDY